MESSRDLNDLVGRTLGQYRIVQRLGAGGMGEVFRAHDERLRRDVAIKVLSRGIFADARARRQFRSEALSLSRINHPNVETVHDFESFGDLDVLVLELVPGVTLGDRIRGRALPERETLRIGVQLASGLAALHEAGIVHRDVKPANMRVTPDNRLKILDLGLATLTPSALAGAETQTGHATVDPGAGTPRYMAPEQVRGEAADARTDVYAAGAVLFEMSTGASPFSASPALALAADILHTPPTPPRALNPALSPELERIILKSLDKDPDRRYQTARDLVVDLERLSASSSSGASVPAPGGSVRRRPIRPSSRAILFGAAALLIAAGWWYWTHRPPPGRPFAERDFVLVADFRAGGEPSPLERTLRTALTIALDQSRYVNVLPRERVVAALRRMARQPDAVVDRMAALDLARRENVAVVLAGTLSPSSRGTMVSVEGVSVADGRTIFVVAEEIAASAPPQSRVDALAARVRRDLGESLDQIARSRPVADVTTHSSEALDRYTRGADEFSAGNLEEADRSLRAALALDTGFAAAHHLLARVYAGMGNASLERKHLEEAWKLRSQLTDRERLVIEASYASLQGNYELGLDRLQTLVGLYPDDASARYQLGVALSNAGRKEAAIVQIRQALQIDPHHLRARGTLELILTEINRPGEALQLFDEAKALGIVTPDLEWGRALALFGADRIDEARQALQALVTRGVEPYKLYGELYLVRLLIYSGQLAAARSALRDDIRADEQGGRAYPERLRRYLIGRLAALEGDLREAGRQAQAILGADSSPSDLRVEHVHFAGILAVQSGDLALAERGLARLRALTGPSTGFARSCELHLIGELARARGRLPQAIEAFGQSAAAYPNYLSHQGRATIYDAQHRDDEALAEWKAVTAARGDVLRNGFPADWIVAEAQVARHLSAAGDARAAEASCALVKAAWGRADLRALRLDVLAPCAAAPR